MFSRKYDIRAMTEEDVKEMIAMGDDNHNNQIRATKDGEVYLSPDIVGNMDTENIFFRFPTFAFGTDSVGPAAAGDRNYIARIYKAIKDNWPELKGDGYIDVF